MEFSFASGGGHPSESLPRKESTGIRDLGGLTPPARRQFAPLESSTGPSGPIETPSPSPSPRSSPHSSATTALRGLSPFTNHSTTAHSPIRSVRGTKILNRYARLLLPAEVDIPPRIHRLRIVLQPSELVRLNFHQAGLVYALLAEANGKALRIDPVIPSDVIIEPIEQGRREIAPHQPWAFGLTLLATTASEAREAVERLREGLSIVGRQAPRPGVMLGGNFRISEIRDLVASRVLNPQEAPTPVPEEHLQEEIAKALTLDRWTLRFTMPLRMSHSKQGLATSGVSSRKPKPQLMDGQRFDPAVFLRKVTRRVQLLGWHAAGSSPPATGQLRVVENHLRWFDMRYSVGPRQKLLPGVCGEITFAGLSPSQVVELVYAQYLHVGENTNFGHGRFRITQLGPPPFPAARAVSLLDLAMGPPHLDRALHSHAIEPHRVPELLRAIRSGRYRPLAPSRFMVRSATGRRMVHVPQPEDHALQFAVLDCLGELLSEHLTASCSPDSANSQRANIAHQIRQLAMVGSLWTIEGPLATACDSIPHTELRRRLQLHLADEALVALILRWVQSGSPEPDQGLPVGSPLAPVLALLFLDEIGDALNSQTLPTARSRLDPRGVPRPNA